MFAPHRGSLSTHALSQRGALRKGRTVWLIWVLLSWTLVAILPAQMKTTVYAPALPDANFMPEELVFDSRGYLYCGHQYEGAASAIYRIPPGGEVVEDFGGNSFDDPDGVDVDAQGNIWVSSGFWEHTYTGELYCVSPSGVAEAIGSNYLKNATSLEVDRAGSFGTAEALLVGNALGTRHSEIVAVVPNGSLPTVTTLWETSSFRVIRNLRFDASGNLWFTGGEAGGEGSGDLFRWSPGNVPQKVPIPGYSGRVLGLCHEPQSNTLLVGLHDDRKLVRTGLDGTVLEVLATDIVPRSIALDAQNRIFVSDQVNHVIWLVERDVAKSTRWELFP